MKVVGIRSSLFKRYWEESDFWFEAHCIANEGLVIEPHDEVLLVETMQDFFFNIRSGRVIHVETVASMPCNLQLFVEGAQYTYCKCRAINKIEMLNTMDAPFDERSSAIPVDTIVPLI